MKRILAIAGALVVGLAVPVGLAGPASAGTVAGYGLSARAVGVGFLLNSPGLLPTGDTVMEFDVPFSRTQVSGGPFINAVASPVYPGDTAAHAGTALNTLAPLPFAIPNYPIVAEANYPPTPQKGASASFGGGGVGEGTASTSATGATVVARTVAESITGVLDVATSITHNNVTISGDKVTSTAS